MKVVARRACLEDIHTPRHPAALSGPVAVRPVVRILCEQHSRERSSTLLLPEEGQSPTSEGNPRINYHRHEVQWHHQIKRKGKDTIHRWHLYCYIQRWSTLKSRVADRIQSSLIGEKPFLFSCYLIAEANDHGSRIDPGSDSAREQGSRKHARSWKAHLSEVSANFLPR